ncbi:MAG: hypothetical protein K2L48_02815, partial [Mycoplasmoidaceae bacterium]|nr:hypothetical protein [Mycoplasmoidaceae bacterium]
MRFLRKDIYKKANSRSGNVFISSNKSGGNISINPTLKGEYLPASRNDDGSYTVDLSNVYFNGNILSSKEVVAYSDSDNFSSKDFLLSDIDNVEITNIREGDILVYENDKWINKPMEYGNGGINENELNKYLSNYVTLNTEQLIIGQKTFSQEIHATADGKIYSDPAIGVACGLKTPDPIAAGSFIKSGGTSNQFLKADGSVDGNSYLLSSSYTASDVLNKIKTVDGSGSGLDADLLDGYHESDFFRKRGSISSSYIDLADGIVNSPYYANYSSGVYSVQRSGSSEIFVNFANTYGGSTSALQFKKSYYSDATLFFRGTIDSNRPTKWQAILSDENIKYYNAGSATKLQNKRSLWGNDFDGTSDIFGSIRIDGTTEMGSMPNIMFHIPNINYAQILMDRNGNLHIKHGSSQDSNYKSLFADWYYSNGVAGWYNATFDGGIYMTEQNYKTKEVYGEMILMVQAIFLGLLE